MKRKSTPWRLFRRLALIGIAALLSLTLVLSWAFPFPTGAESAETEAGLSREAATSAAGKLKIIQEGSLASPSSPDVRLSEVEANSYLYYDVPPYLPPGLSKVRMHFSPNRTRGIAEVDFDKVKEALRRPPDLLMSFLLHAMPAGGIV